MKEIIEKLEEKIKEIYNEQGLTTANIDVVSKLVDMHKDLKNEEYWEEKIMRYRDNYRDNGNYRGDYGRRSRDSRGRYKGEEYLEEMRESYRDYSESNSYGHQSEITRSLDYMLQSVVEFIEMIKREANSQEEIELIQKYTDRISNM